MKLVLQITAGILLATFIGVGVWVGVSVGIPMYAQNQVEKNFEHYAE